MAMREVFVDLLIAYSRMTSCRLRDSSVSTRRSFTMSQVQDTQLNDLNYKPGTVQGQGKYRVEFDSMGQVEVPADKLWGAQTQRSLIHFSIGNDRMPIEVYRAYGYVKKAAAIVNERQGHLPKDKADLIIASADEVI